MNSMAMMLQTVLHYNHIHCFHIKNISDQSSVLVRHTILRQNCSNFIAI